MMIGVLLVVGLLSESVGETGIVRAQDPAPPADSVDVGWPRPITSGGTTFTVYPPQLDAWQGRKLDAHAAVGVKEAGAQDLIYGVIGLAAHTDVDKVNRQVYLNDTKITKASFPSAASKASEWERALQRKMPARSKALSLDRLEAQLAIQEQRTTTAEHPLKNDPPKVLISTSPAILLLIDGEPALRPVEGGLQRGQRSVG